MAYWLLKTEPDCFSWHDLTRDRKATWDGVTNPVALKNIRAMKKGDLAFIYHTGTQRRIIGVAKVTSGPYPDPKASDEKLVVIDLEPKATLPRGVSLDEIRADPAFQDWVLLRNSRLSVMEVPEPMWKRIEEMSHQ
jgi:predicted RNA-binding protein with PUA-like domain